MCRWQEWQIILRSQLLNSLSTLLHCVQMTAKVFPVNTSQLNPASHSLGMLQPPMPTKQRTDTRTSLPTTTREFRWSRWTEWKAATTSMPTSWMDIVDLKHTSPLRLDLLLLIFIIIKLCVANHPTNHLIIFAFGLYHGGHKLQRPQGYHDGHSNENVKN